MMQLLLITTTVLLMTTGITSTMAIEQAKYNVIKTDNQFEIREYESHILAETFVTGDMDEAGKQAFRRLFRYISGNNQSRQQVEMTAPVSQQPAGEKIQMTAPVGQRPDNTGWYVSFMMPDKFSIQSLPIPEDSTISLREIPQHQIAAVRYSGTWSERRYLQHKSELIEWINETGLTPIGPPTWARYNSPFTPWFLRRNEILIPISRNTNQDKADNPLPKT
jgi:effector-binding domain-containing protein